MIKITEENVQKSLDYLDENIFYIKDKQKNEIDGRVKTHYDTMLTGLYYQKGSLLILLGKSSR